jgi:hypothetical protein
MSASNLQRIALGYGWKPEAWHLKLASTLQPMAVIGLFRHATFLPAEKGALSAKIRFPEAAMHNKALLMRGEIEKALGCTVLFDVSGAIEPSLRESSPYADESAAECQRRLDEVRAAQAAEVDKRTTPEFKAAAAERASQMWKKRKQKNREDA